MLDKGTVSVMAHILIRDFDTDEIILNRRDAAIRPKPTDKVIEEQTSSSLHIGEETTDESVVVE